MEITERELRDMAATVDEAHHEAMAVFREQTADLHHDVTHSRRRFLKGTVAGAGVAGAALAIGPTFAPTNRLLPKAGAQGLTDADIAAFAESVELAAVAAYNMAAGVLSPATKPVAMLFAQHHQEHAGAFAALAGEAATGAPNNALVTALTPQLQGIKNEKMALDFAFVLENQAASTYAFGLTALMSPDAVSGAATILPIESMHAGVLGAANGKDLPGIFLTGAFLLAEVGDGTDPKKGLDPAVFPVG
ncbi:MAG: ferritin-like domain-containing protein [Acidimicrobiia bacterium]